MNYIHIYLIKAIVKPQYVDNIPKAVKGTVEKILAQKDERKMQAELTANLGKLLFK